MFEELKRELIELFGERVAFNRIERLLYSSDLGSLPDMARARINTYPDAVVQPGSHDELTALVSIAKKYRIPLVPRGAASSGYGGTVPVNGGIVVDFYRLNRVTGVNTEERTAVVEPGVTWSNLEKQLGEYGLSLRLYPGSMVSATVAGWIANGGGVGIGSFEYGYINENVIEVETVTPEGTRVISADDMNLVYGMAGTTGLISRVKLKVRESENDIYVAGAFKTIKDMIGAFRKLHIDDVKLWHAGYRDASHVELTYKALEKHAYMHRPSCTEGSHIIPPDRHIALFVYPESRDSAIGGKLSPIINQCGGEVLSEEAARFEWEETFYPLRFKTLGPSVIPSEAVIPTENVGAIVQKTNGAIIGTLVNGGRETVVMIYRLDDERRHGFAPAFARSYALINAARQLGGRPYVIGMYLAGEAEQVIGRDELLKIYKYRNEVDPEHILNPGKVFPVWLDNDSPAKHLDRMIAIAQRMNIFMGIAEKIYDIMPAKKAADESSMVNIFPYSSEVVWDTFACARCGYCRSECPQFNAIGWESASPRGKFNFLRYYASGEAKIDERMAEMFYVCTTCQQCNVICQVGTKVEDHWMLELRPALKREGFKPPMVALRQACNIIYDNNTAGKPQDKRNGWMPSDLKCEEMGRVGYFAGCAVSFNYGLRNLPINAIRILNRAGIKPVYLGPDEWCCGGSLFTTGYIDEALEKIEHNANEFNRRGIETVITSCSGCWLHLSHLYPLLTRKLKLDYNVRVRHITEAINDLLNEGRIALKLPVELNVTYHDPCHIGRGGGIFEPPRRILQSIPDLQFIEMPRNREHSACCGRHVMRYPRLGDIINNSRVTEAINTGVDAVVGACPTCETNLRMGLENSTSGMEVVDISDLVAWSMGLPVLAVSSLPRLLNCCEEVGV